MALEGILERLTSLEGVRLVALAGRDGLVIACVPRESAGDVAGLAAYGADALNAAESLGTAAQRGALTGIVIDFADALFSIDPLGEMALTVAWLDAASALVPLRQALRQLRGELLATLDTL
jgi:predicted regulator of Ras-like GTPase activity (Roadblock/LC7/MglB family)